MANSITGRQWKIDTPSATAILTSAVKVKEIEFTQYAADADEFSVTDRNGRIVWEGNGRSDLSPFRSGSVGWVDGIIVPTLTAGAELLIYLC